MSRPYVEQIDDLLAHPDRLKEAMRSLFKLVGEPDTNDRYDFFARKFMIDMNIESSSLDWNEETTQDLAALMRALADHSRDAWR